MGRKKPVNYTHMWDGRWETTQGNLRNLNFLSFAWCHCKFRVINLPYIARTLGLLSSLLTVLKLTEFKYFEDKS